MTIDFLSENIESLSPETLFEEKVISFIREFQSDSPTVPVQTSGSTGTPKVFEIEKSKMLNSAKMTCDFLGLKPGDSALICLPVEYISGKMMIVRSYERKLKLLVRDTSLSPLENLSQTVDFCAMTPLQVENSLDKIHLIKNLIIGGAAVSESLKAKVKSQVRNSGKETRVFETYGMSETLSHIALKELFPNEEVFFRVFQGVEISLDERSCLQIYAPNLNSEVLKTNDLVELENEKQFKFLGRVDNVINSGGAKIFPEQVEQVIKKVFPFEVVCLGVPDEVFGQKLIAVVETNPSEEIKQQILQLNFEKSFHKPKGIIFVDEIPRTPNGKVNRLVLLKNVQQNQ